MPAPPGPLAIDLKELLRRALESKISRAVLVLRRAASLALNEPEVNLTDTDRALLASFIDGDRHDTPMTIGLGRNLSTRFQDKQLDRLITPYHRHVAEGQVRSDEAIRLGTHSGKLTAWELTLDLVGKAVANRKVGYSNPVIYRELIEEYCWSLRQGERSTWEEGEEHINAFQREGFTRELLEELWKNCPSEAAEMRLPRPVAATAHAQATGATTTPPGRDDEREGDRGVNTPTNTPPPHWRSGTHTTSEDSRLAAVNLKEILIRVHARAKELHNLVERRACWLLAQDDRQDDLTDAQRAVLRAVADARQFVDVVRGDERLKQALAQRNMRRAEKEILREDAARLGSPWPKTTALEVVMGAFFEAAERIVDGFEAPQSAREWWVSRFWRYCEWLSTGDKSLIDDETKLFMRAGETIGIPGFVDDLLRRLRRECPEEAKELQLDTAAESVARASRADSDRSAASEASVEQGILASVEASSETPQDTVAPSGEWSEPMSKAELARRVFGGRKDRSRDVEPLLKQFGFRPITAKTISVRLDTMDTNTRKKVENPA